MMKKKYEKITKEQVLDVLIRCHLNVMDPVDVISAPNIAYLLKTSEYQVRKYIGELKKDGLVELAFLTILDEELVLPIKGFQITDKAKELDQYKIAERNEREIFKEIFGF